MKPKSRRKIRWYDDVVNDLTVMKVNNWVGCVQNRTM